MKKFNQIIGMFACLMAFTACQEDVLVNDQQQKIYTLAGKMSGGKTMSRAQIQLNNPNSGEEIAYWNNGDSFTLYLPSDNSLAQSVFTISGDYSESGNGDKQTAVFSTENPVTANTNYVAIYPAGLPQNDKDISFEFERKLNFTDASNYNEVWSKYLQNNMYMIANGTLSADGMNTVNFEHLCAMVRITYTNSTDSEVTINAFRLGGNNMFYDFRRNFRMSQHPGFNSGSSTSYYDVHTTGLKVAAGESTDLYILFFPSEIRENAEIGIFINANGEEKSVFMEGSKIVEANNGVTSFEAGKRYWFKVSQINSGLIWSKDFTTEVVTIPNPQLSLALQQELGEDVVTLNEDGNAVMSLMDVRAITSLDFSWKNYIIPSLDGIEMFENLQRLDCCNTELEKCDVSQNLKLRDLSVNSNYLVSLDLGNNANLSYLNCSYNNDLQSLDLSGCPSLTTLEIVNTALYDIEIPYPDRLNTLCFGGNDKLQIDLNDFPNLRSLGMVEMGLTTLNIPDAIKSDLYTLKVENNQLTSIDLSKYPKLETLQCWNNEITSLNLSVVPNLRNLDCEMNRISFLDVTPLKQLSWLICGNQKENTTLTLKLSDTQKERWNNDWKNNNPSVILGDVAPDSGNDEGDSQDPTHRTVSTFSELQQALDANANHIDIELKNDIVLESPLTIFKSTFITSGKNAKLIVSDNFNWGASNAAITNKGDHLQMHNVSFYGSQGTGFAEKYLLKSTMGNIRLSGKTIFDSRGVEHAICIENSRIDIHEETSITAGRNALYILANSTFVQSFIVTQGVIKGRIYFIADFLDEKYPNVLDVQSGTVNGDLFVKGQYADRFLVMVQGDSTVNGNGWPSNDAPNTDPNARPVSNQAELEKALMTSGPIKLTENITLTTPITITKGTPIFLNDKQLTISPKMDWGTSNAAINVAQGGQLDIIGSGNGFIYGIEGQEMVQKALFQVEGKMVLQDGVIIKPLNFETTLYVKNGSCHILDSSIAGSSHYAIKVDASPYCDVDISKSAVYGDIRFEMNNQTYSTNHPDNENFFYFGINNNSTVSGHVEFDGPYQHKATGYLIRVDNTVKVMSGDNWKDSRITYVE